MSDREGEGDGVCVRGKGEGEGEPLTCLRIAASVSAAAGWFAVMRAFASGMRARALTGRSAPCCRRRRPRPRPSNAPEAFIGPRAIRASRDAPVRWEL